MGQKSNILTIRNSKLQLNLLNDNPKTFLYGFTFLKNFEKLLNKKNVLIINKELNFEANKCFLNIITFFRTSKTMNYRRKGFYFKKLKAKPFLTENLTFKKLILTQFKLLKNNLIVISLQNLNKFIHTKSLIFFYKKFKRFVGVLFARRLNLFIDFLKLTVFFTQSKVSLNSYLYLLGQIFRVLPKRKHNRFLFFLKILFQIIIDNSSKLFPNSTNLVAGIKFIVNGKLKGKTRASSNCIQIGSTPIQSIDKNIEFARLHVYTLYGAFGFQMWIYRK